MPSDRIPWTKPPRPPEKTAHLHLPWQIHGLLHMSFLLLLLLLLAAIIPTAAQDISTISKFPDLLDLPIRGSAAAVHIQPPSSSDSTLYVTFNICSAPSDGSSVTADPPRIFITNSSSVSFPSTDSTSFKKDTSGTGSSYSTSTKGVVSNLLVKGTNNVWALALNQGFANWTGIANDGLWVNVTNVNDGVNLEVGVSYDAPVHAIYRSQPLLGDTTFSQSLIFSPSLPPYNITVPSYPNYTLSSPYPLQDTQPSLGVKQTIAFVPTTSSPILIELSNSMCAMQKAFKDTQSDSDGNSTTNSVETVVQRLDGWRRSWWTSGLQSGKNYTAWVTEVGGGNGRGSMWGPIMLATKQNGFPCPLAYNLDLCPSIAYAAAIDADTTDPVTSLPDALTATLVASLNAFSTSVSSTACGRDLYSPVSSCYECFNEYREWLCRMIIPQCADTVTSSSATIQPLTIQRTPLNPRTNLTSTPSYTYNELLPCLSICRRADRTCPAFLGFTCPVRTVNGNESYAFWSPRHGEEGSGEGEEDGGIDEWGNRWCNGMLEDG